MNKSISLRIVFCLTGICIFLFIPSLPQQLITGEQLKMAIGDSAKIKLLNDLAAKYIYTDPDSGIYFGEQALSFGLHTKRFDMLDETHRVLGWCYFNGENYAKAKMHFQFSLNDSTLQLNERIRIYDALVKASEKTGDFKSAFYDLKNSQSLRDTALSKKVDEKLKEMQYEYDTKIHIGKQEYQKKESYWKIIKLRQEQFLLGITIIAAAILIIAIVLWVLNIYKGKAIQQITEEKNILIAENSRLQNEMIGYEKLKGEAGRGKRETRTQTIAAEKPFEEKEKKAPQQSIIDQYKSADVEQKKELLPKIETFLMIIPTQLKTIEQAFARHDWEMINTTLQTMKPIISAAGLQQSETYINEINEHVSANATNRAVVKLLSVKSTCTKAIDEIKRVLERDSEH